MSERCAGYRWTTQETCTFETCPGRSNCAYTGRAWARAINVACYPGFEVDLSGESKALRFEVNRDEKAHA